MSGVALGGGPSAPLFDGREASRWGLSFAVVLGLHGAAVLGAMAYRSAALEPGEALPAVMIDLAPPPAAPTAAPNDQPPSEAVPEAALPDPVLDAPPDVPEPDVTPPEPTVLAEVPPLDPVPEVPFDETLVRPPVVKETAAVALPPPPKPQPKPKPKEKVVERKKPPKPAQARQADRQEAKRPPATEAGARTTSAIPSASSGSAAASRASWQGALVSHLRRLLYPLGGESGSASVRLSVDRCGRVLGAFLVSSGGAGDLDAEALAVFRRAQPL
ncbi:MAG: hypothetical protein JWR08_1745, partial [Enterovirga sp.]|nr:hypothetical protein [Enterovirga sp.]